MHLSIGPDGALYVLDFYREVIESPLSLPEDIKKKMNLESRGRGRIWRVVPDSISRETQASAKRKPALRHAPVDELVKHLADRNIWWRLTAQRLLVERQDRAAIKPLEKLARDADFAPGRAHALWTLHGLGALDDALIVRALKDPEAGVREQALRLADERLAKSEPLRRAVMPLADDPSPRVRFQLAFTLGEADTPETVAALARVARKDVADPWTQTAVLSSAGHTAPALLEALVHDREITTNPDAAHLQFLTRLAGLVAARNTRCGPGPGAGAPWGAGGQVRRPWQIALLNGLGQGLQNTSRPLSQVWEAPPPRLKEAVAQARPLLPACGRHRARGQGPGCRAGCRRAASGRGALFARGAGAARGSGTAEPRRGAARRPCAPSRPTTTPAFPTILLSGWSGYSPGVRREVLEALFARPVRLGALLDAVEARKVLAGQIEPIRIEQLRKHPDGKLRQRALASWPARPLPIAARSSTITARPWN